MPRTFRGGDYVADLMALVNRAEICRRIGQALKTSGLTQRELAGLMHVHTNTVQNWSSAKKAIVPWDRLDEIAAATGVTREWLMYGDSEPGEGSHPAQLARIAETQVLQGRLLAELLDRVDELLRERRQSG